MDDTPLFRQDPFVSLLAPADGVYVVQVRETNYGGGDTSRYVLHVGDFARPAAVFPAGGQAGTEVSVKLLGDAGDTTQAVKLPPAGTPFEFFPGGAPTPNPFRVSNFPNVLEGEAKVTAWPVAFNGVIEKPGEADVFRFRAAKGDEIDVQAFAFRIGSPLDSVVAVLDSQGEVVAANDDDETHDSRVRVTIPADGEYAVRVTDKRKQAGPRVHLPRRTRQAEAGAERVPPAAGPQDAGPADDRRAAREPRDRVPGRAARRRERAGQADRERTARWCEGGHRPDRRGRVPRAGRVRGRGGRAGRRGSWSSFTGKWRRGEGFGFNAGGHAGRPRPGDAAFHAVELRRARGRRHRGGPVRGAGDSRGPRCRSCADSTLDVTGEGLAIERLRGADRGVRSPCLPPGVESADQSCRDPARTRAEAVVALVGHRHGGTWATGRLAGRGEGRAGRGVRAAIAL